MTKLKSLALAVALAATGVGTAQAGTASTTFDVNMEIVSDCSIQADNMVFPQTGLLTNNVDATSQLHIWCTAATPYLIRLGNGEPREMVNGSGAVITYDLYQDVSRSIKWGILGGGTSGPYQLGQALAGTSTGGNESITVYGRVGPQTSVLADNYSQTMNAQIDF
jgi:spore coat protein U-like protein